MYCRRHIQQYRRHRTKGMLTSAHQRPERCSHILAHPYNLYQSNHCNCNRFHLGMLGHRCRCHTTHRPQGSSEEELSDPPANTRGHEKPLNKSDRPTHCTDGPSHQPMLNYLHIQTLRALRCHFLKQGRCEMYGLGKSYLPVKRHKAFSHHRDLYSLASDIRQTYLSSTLFSMNMLRHRCPIVLKLK